MLKNQMKYYIVSKQHGFVKNASTVLSGAVVIRTCLSEVTTLYKEQWFTGYWVWLEHCVVQVDRKDN